jgi:hypothetical protein
VSRDSHAARVACANSGFVGRSIDSPIFNVEIHLTAHPPPGCEFRVGPGRPPEAMAMQISVAEQAEVDRRRAAYAELEVARGHMRRN